MIEAKQTTTVNVDINGVWNYVRDMSRWADIFPGCRGYQLIDGDDSEWTIKVGVGGLVRTVGVLVHVDKWDDPGGVDFSYRLKSEPVVGGGTYRAVANGPGETQLTLQVEIKGSGQMAPMWEAMCKPVIPVMLKQFTGDLKTAIETSTGVTAPVTKPSVFGRLAEWLRNIGRSIFGGVSRRTDKN